MARQTQQTRFDGSARRFDMRALLRLALWGTSAAAALMLAEAGRLSAVHLRQTDRASASALA
jgi:hypothetical protein